jgi:hypothetical protein
VTHTAWPWAAAALLGAYHGLDPSMGWLFAVALGLQERRRARVISALGPIGAGHLVAIAAAALLIAAARITVAASVVRSVGAAILVGFGVFRLWRPRAHPRLGGMRVNGWELALWSFVMATAHGAGLMLVPVLLGMPAPPDEHGLHAHMAGMTATLHDAGGLMIMQSAAIVLVHIAAMLTVMSALAVVVYQWVGLAILRRAWINLDFIWAGALITAGVLAVAI